jgi:hypothetical protein
MNSARFGKAFVQRPAQPRNKRLTAVLGGIGRKDFKRIGTRPDVRDFGRKYIAELLPGRHLPARRQVRVEGEPRPNDGEDAVLDKRIKEGPWQ